MKIAIVAFCLIAQLFAQEMYEEFQPQEISAETETLSDAEDLNFAQTKHHKMMKKASLGSYKYSAPSTYATSYAASPVMYMKKMKHYVQPAYTAPSTYTVAAPVYTAQEPVYYVPAAAPAYTAPEPMYSAPIQQAATYAVESAPVYAAPVAPVYTAEAASTTYSVPTAAAYAESAPIMPVMPQMYSSAIPVYQPSYAMKPSIHAMKAYKKAMLKGSKH